MQKGDLATKDPPPRGTYHHVMIWVRLVDDGISDDYIGPMPPDYYGYSYEVWESTTQFNNGVSLNQRQGDARTHFRQWIDDVVFKNCN